MILVLGGTSDSSDICKMLNEYSSLSYVISVTTEYGKELSQEYCDNVILGKLTKDDMIKFINDNDIKQIIDSTHPYAIEVSKNAIECSRLTGIDYIRYERKSLIEEITYDNKFIVNDIDEACKIANKIGNNIFIGTGSKNLNKYVEKIPEKKLIVRVLPISEVLISCEKLGLNADNIIAMKGPFSKSINEEIYKHYDIDLVITKESGVAGGFLEKVHACEELDIPVIILSREKLNYPKVVNQIDDLEKLL